MAGDAQPYFRLQLALQESCKVLRKFFEKSAKDDLTSRGLTYTNIQDYLKYKEPDIKLLRNRHILSQYQYDILYNMGRPNMDIDMDITLLTCLTLNLILSVSLEEEKWIEDIRAVRNTVNHTGDIMSITSHAFGNMWKDTVDATNGLAKLIDSDFANEVDRRLTEIKDKELPQAGPFLGIINDLSKTTKELLNRLEKLDNLDTTIENVIHVTELNDGSTSKKLKTFDNRLGRMQERFSMTTRAKLQENFSPKEKDLGAIKTKMASSTNPVCVVGSNDGALIPNVLLAIQQLEHRVGRCVEMALESDWGIVNTEDVSVVLYRDPLGINDLNVENISNVHRLFDKILAYTRDLNPPNRFYVVMTVDSDVFSEYSNTQGVDVHVIFDDVLRLNEDHPVVVKDEKSLPTQPFEDSVFSNLREQTKTYVSYHIEKNVKPEIPDALRDKLKNELVVRINGPRSSGKTTLAIHLMRPYRGNHLLLQTPSDMRHVSLTSVSVVLIEDLGGKHVPDRQSALQWYPVFDILLAAVDAGKLRVIVVTETSNYDKCQLTDHHLLRHCYDMSTSDVVVTPEDTTSITQTPEMMLENDNSPVETEDEIAYTQSAIYSKGTSPESPGNKSGDIQTESIAPLVPSLLHARFNARKIEYSDEGLFRACAYIPTGQLILAYADNLILLDMPYRFLRHRIAFKMAINDIEVVSPNTAVLCRSDKHLQLLKVSASFLNVGESFSLDMHCESVDVYNGELYVLCENENKAYVLILDISKNGIETKRKIDIESKCFGRSMHIRVGKNGDKLFLSNVYNARLACLKMDGEVIYQTDVASYRGLLVDHFDNVLVCRNNNISVIDAKGHQVKQLLDDTIPEDQVTPLSICYRDSEGRIAVGCIDTVITLETSPNLLLHS